MTATLEQCERQARDLPIAERAQLVEHLLESLDEPDENENEALWMAEGKRRYDAYCIGDLSAREAHDVIQDARKRIAGRR